jgi:hypothetical protein
MLLQQEQLAQELQLALGLPVLPVLEPKQQAPQQVHQRAQMMHHQLR